MATVNLYDVLEVENDATKKDIKVAYKKLVKEFHPDRPTGDTDMFELVTHAYNVLSNPETRKEYDHLHKLVKQSETDHHTLKQGASEYYKAEETDVTKKSKEESTTDFKKAFSDMDHKHNYMRGKEDDVLNEEATKRRLTDLEMSREQEDIELTHDKIFTDGAFNISQFNAAFDVMHGSLTGMVPHTGNPNAYAGPSGVGGVETNYSSLDNLEDLYIDEDNSTNIGLDGQNLSTTKFHNTASKKLSKREIKKMHADYTTDHSTIDVDYNKSLEDRIRERDLNTQTYDNREMGDYNTDPDCGGYGIFGEIGLDKASTITWDNDEDVKQKYKKLLEMRKKDTSLK